MVNCSMVLFCFFSAVQPILLVLVMAARQLAGRRPLYFTADVSILLLFFVA